MHKNKFISSTFILLVSGFIVKILGMIIRIIYTRLIGEYGMSLYSLVMPTFSLVSSVVLFSLPLSISKLVSSAKYSSKSIGLSAFFVAAGTNILFVGFVALFSKFIALNFLHEPLCYGLLLCSLTTIPFITISAIIKGYFYGKQNMKPSSIGNVIEQITRLILILLLLPKIVNISPYYGVIFVILLNIVTELISVFVMYLFLPKKVKLSDFKYCSSCTKDLLNISLPSVSSRIIGNVSYFFEPIIITTILLFLGLSKNDIVLQYGLYNSFALPLLLMPNFFILAISNALLPEISRLYANRKLNAIVRRIKQVVFISFLIGLVCCLIIFFFRSKLLLFLYGSNLAVDYVKYLAFFFILYYLEAPLSTVLVAIGKNRASFFITLISVIIKNIILIIFLFSGFKMYSLLISEIVNILVVVILNIIVIHSFLTNKKETFVS